jgi:NOL1/NOP2/fmu family ribosome biogenesis protein
MFRKLDYALDEWSPQNVDTCVTRQKEILANVWSSLKDGGLAFYSTCTFNTKENEAVARWAIDNLDAQSISLSIDPSWGVLEQREDDVWSYRCFPGTCRGEGFSLCILRKNDRMSRLPRRREKQGKLLFEEIKQKDTHQVSNWVTSPETVFARDITNGIYAFNPRLYPDVLLLSAVVKTIHAGCLLAEQKGKDFVPFPGLPFSTICNHSAFNSVELDAYVALTYFSKNTFEIGSSADGWVLLKYKNHGMGIVKKIATRLNNPYPHEWKIKMQFSPTECASVL